MSCYICGCVKNCAKYIDSVFANILEISKIFLNFKIVIAYDESTDNTLDKLNEYKNKLGNVIIIMNNNKSNIRTENISNARNSIIEFITSDILYSYEYFIMMDFDDVCSGKLDISVLLKYLNRNDWDALSFNKKNYYDIWALSFEPYICSCFQFDHYSSKGNEVVNLMKKEIVDKLSSINENQLLEVYSAFNGFSIYRTSKFINCKYEYLVSKNFKYISKEKYYEIIHMLNSSGKLTSNIYWNNRPSDCEHRHFHLESKNKNNAKICISPLYFFIE